MGLIELTYWRISRIDIFTAAIENFSKISREKVFFIQKTRVWLLPFFYENSKLATNETPNIAFVLRAVNQKFEIKAQKCPWQTSKCPWQLFFKMPLTFPTCPWKFWKKCPWNFRPCPWQFSIICPWKCKKCPWQNSKKVVSRALWGVTGKKKTLKSDNYQIISFVNY